MRETSKSHKRHKSTASSIFFQSLKSKSMSISHLNLLRKKSKKSKLLKQRNIESHINADPVQTKELPKVCAVLESVQHVTEYVTVV